MRLSSSLFHDVISIMRRGGLIQPPPGENRVNQAISRLSQAKLGKNYKIYCLWDPQKLYFLFQASGKSNPNLPSELLCPSPINACLTLWHFYCIEAKRTCLPSKRSEGRFPNIHRIYQHLSYHCSQGILVTFSIYLPFVLSRWLLRGPPHGGLATTPDLLENADSGARPTPPDPQKCCEVGMRVGSSESMYSPTT